MSRARDVDWGGPPAYLCFSDLAKADRIEIDFSRRAVV